MGGREIHPALKGSRKYVAMGFCRDFSELCRNLAEALPAWGPWWLPPRLFHELFTAWAEKYETLSVLHYADLVEWTREMQEPQP